MINDSNYSTLFALVSAAVNGKCNSLPEEKDWAAAIALAAKHGVGALTWDGLMALYKLGHVADAQLPASKLKLRWIGLVQRAERNYKLQQHALEALDGVLGRQQIKMLVFKGMALSLYFPTPNHRECCDVDVYAFYGKQKQLEFIFTRNGGEEGDENAKHSTVNYNNVHFELHRSFVYRCGERRMKRMNEELEALLNDSTQLMDYHNIYKPSLSFDELFVLIHAANHYKTEGLALRHIIDWALVLRAIGYRWNEVKLHEYGLLRFARILNRIAREHLGFDIPEELCRCDDATYNRVLHDILYPQYEAEHNMSKGNLLIRKYKRFTSRKWVYPLVGDNFWRAALSSVVAHLLDPVSILRGNK